MTNSTMSQSEFLIITLNLHKARETSRLQGAFRIASHWLKICREIFKPVTKRGNRNHNLQTARRGKLNDGLRRRNQLIKRMMSIYLIILPCFMFLSSDWFFHHLWKKVRFQLLCKAHLMHKTIIQNMNRDCKAKLSALSMLWVCLQSWDKGWVKNTETVKQNFQPCRCYGCAYNHGIKDE